MTNTTNIEHLVLKIKANQQSIQFYDEFLSLLGYIQDIKTAEYINYTNGKIPIGLYFTPEFTENIEISAGLGHIAWQTNHLYIYQKLVVLIKKYDLEYETLGEKRQHHTQNFETISFYCPSGNRLELVLGAWGFGLES